MTRETDPELFPQGTPGSRSVRRRSPSLSKSRFIGGLQCLKRVYLECFNRELADPTPPDRQALFDTGSRVGVIARKRYPGGRLVTEDHLRHAQAERKTRRALDEENLPAIYEAAFTFERIRIRADILSRVDADTFDLIEVKSGARVKAEHHHDVAIQLHVLRGAGVRIRNAGLLHLNRDYVYEGGAHDLQRLFRLADLTEEAGALLPEVRAQLTRMWSALAAPAAPEIGVGPHCTKPYVCPFFGHCHTDGDVLAHPVEELYRAGGNLLGMLRASGVEEIHHIPDGCDGLSEIQARQREAVISGAAVIDRRGASKALRAFRRPVHFLDFETTSPALPLYAGTRPYDVIPFQWSDHVLHADGTLRHHAFLHEGGDDPRPDFARSLIEVVGGAGTIVTYSGYESARIRDLARWFPELAPALRGLDERITDFLPIIRDHVYDPEFHGSFSLKSVFPALLPGFGYQDLEISEGSLASLAWAEMIDPETPADRRAALRTQLLAYCKRDTEAMLELFRKLAG